MKERNESIDCLKGIAILLVMFGHVQVHNKMTDPYIYDVIESVQMPMFFLISGYLAGAGSKITTFAQYLNKMKKRALAYLLPFSSWLIVQHARFIPRAVKTVLFQLDYGLWFLVVLFLFTWMAYTAQLVQAKTKHDLGFWVPFIGSCGLILVAYMMGVTFLSPFLLVTYLPFYVSAYFVGMYPGLFAKIPENIQRILAYIGGVVFLGMVIVFDLVTVTGIVMLGIQTIASFLSCFVIIRLVQDWKTNRIKIGLAQLGAYTLEIYVLHYQFATVMNPDGIVYTFWSLRGLGYTVVAFAAMSAITAVGIYVINRLKIFRLFLFGKKS